MSDKYAVRVVKLDKGCFAIEYKNGPWSEWKEITKTFKTRAKADEYLATHML